MAGKRASSRIKKLSKPKSTIHRSSKSHQFLNNQETSTALTIRTKTIPPPKALPIERKNTEPLESEKPIGSARVPVHRLLKRHRVLSEEDQVDSQHQRKRAVHEAYLGLRIDKTAGTSIQLTPTVKPGTSSGLTNRKKTGSCNSKIPRRKGHAGGSFQQSDEDLFQSTSTIDFTGSILQVKATTANTMSDVNKISSQCGDSSLPVASTKIANIIDISATENASSTVISQTFFPPPPQLPSTSQHPVMLNKIATRTTRLEVDRGPSSSSTFSIPSPSSWLSFRPLCFTPLEQPPASVVNMTEASLQVNCTPDLPINLSAPSTYSASHSSDTSGLIISNLNNLQSSSSSSASQPFSNLLRFVTTTPANSQPPSAHQSSSTKFKGHGRSSTSVSSSSSKRPQRLDVFTAIGGSGSRAANSGGGAIRLNGGGNLTNTASANLSRGFSQQSSNVNQRIMQLQQSFSDRSLQLILLQEINQALLMGSEEALAGIAVRNLVSCILELLDAGLSDDEEGLVIELKNLSCNILSHLMDVLPKAAEAVVPAIPLLLNTMSCSFVGDILERVINVLEQVSRRHGRQVLLYDGITAVMGYYDFVTAAQHRTILSMIANCFAELREDDFDPLVTGCLPGLCERLGQESEPRCVERICLCFARLIEAYRGEPDKLKIIASHSLFQNLKQLMAASPPVVSNMKDIANMLATICINCPELAVDLLKLGLAETIFTLLTEQKPSESLLLVDNPEMAAKTNSTQHAATHNSIAFSLENRGSENVFAIIHLVGALMPSAPPVEMSLSTPLDGINFITEDNHQSPEDREEKGDSRSRHVDVRITQIDLECRRLECQLMGTTTPSQNSKRKPSIGDDTARDVDMEARLQQRKSSATKIALEELVFVKSVHTLLPLLLDVYAELNGIAVRLKTIEAIQRMVFYARPLLLSRTLSPRIVSGMIANMMASPEFAIIVAGLQLAHLFFHRLPLLFSAYFRKEGVLFHLQRLSVRPVVSQLLCNMPTLAQPSQMFVPEMPEFAEHQQEAVSRSSTLRRTHITTVPPDTPTPPSRLRQNYKESHGMSPIAVTHSIPSISSSLASTTGLAQFPTNFSPATTDDDDDEEEEGEHELVTSCSTPSSPTSSSSSSTVDMESVRLDATLKNSHAMGSISSQNISGQDVTLRCWIANQCEFLHARITTFVNTNGNAAVSGDELNASMTLVSKASASNKSGANKKRSPSLFRPPADLVPELESICGLLMEKNNTGAWVSGLERLATLLTGPEAPSPFEIHHSGLLKAIHYYLIKADEGQQKLRVFIFLRVFAGSQFTQGIQVTRQQLCDNPYSLTAALKALQGLREPNPATFATLVHCLLACLHQQEHFQFISGPSFLASAGKISSNAGEGRSMEIYTAEDMHRTHNHHHHNQLQSSLFFRATPPGSNDSPSSSMMIRSRRISKQGFQSGVGVKISRSLLPRRWSAIIPGFLKLDLVRCDKLHQPTEKPASPIVPTNGGKSGRKSSYGTQSTAVDLDASLIKGTFWENAPIALPLHVNALITTRSLQRLLIQRSFIASLVTASASTSSSSSPSNTDIFYHHLNRPSASADDNGDEGMLTSPSTSSTSTAVVRRRLYAKRNPASGLFYTSESATPDDRNEETLRTAYSLRQASSNEDGVVNRGGNGLRLEVVDRRRGNDQHQVSASSSRIPSALLRRGHQYQQNSHQENSEKSTSQSFSRPKSMSLLAAFGMLQFSPNSSTLPASEASPTSRSISAAQTNHHPTSALIASATSSCSTSNRRSHGEQHSSSSSISKLHRSMGFSSSSNVTSKHYSGKHHPNNRYSMIGCSSGEMDGGHLVPVFYINGVRIPPQMPLYQAVRCYSVPVVERTCVLHADTHCLSMTEQNKEDQINTFMWRQVHSIEYRLEKADTGNAMDSPSRLNIKHASSSSSQSRNNILASSSKLSPTASLSAAISCLKRPRQQLTTVVAAQHQDQASSSLLFSLLTDLPPPASAHNPNSFCRIDGDEHLKVNLSLLRMLHALSEHGSTLDDLLEPFPIIVSDHFRNQKLTAKAARQLQDVFSVLAGNLPAWLVHLVYTCPFLFPFALRQAFFYAHNFDRDRAILHLQDSVTNGGSESDASSHHPLSPSAAIPNNRGGLHPSMGREASSPLSLLVNSLFSNGGQSSPQTPDKFILSSNPIDSDGGSSSSSSSSSAVAALENLIESSAGVQLHRQKLIVHRDPKRLLREAETTLAELRDSRALLEIAFDGEVGFGLGPTLEFYTLVSHHLMSAGLNLWHGHELTSDGAYLVAPPPGLYPRPLPKNIRASQARDIRGKFFFLGQLMARSLLDWRQLDLPLSSTLFKWFLYLPSASSSSSSKDAMMTMSALGSRSALAAGVTAADLSMVDPSFARHYRALLRLHRKLRRGDVSQQSATESEIDDLCLNFTLPGYQIELCRNGTQTAVTGANLGEYLSLCANWLLVEGVQRQVLALIEGFDSVLPGVRLEKLAHLFRPDECEGLFCGAQGGDEAVSYRDQFAFLNSSPSSNKLSVSHKKTARTTSGWDVETLMKSCLCDHGYTLQSQAIQYLFDILSEFDESERRLFVQFITGSPRLPIGGFRSLKPPLKIVMKREVEERADHHLPSVMTCQNYLKLPNYSSKAVMREKLLYAIREGQNAFHLS